MTAVNDRVPRRSGARNVRIDLHTHSLHSDGSDTPTELVEKAAAAGLDVGSLTHHDTVIRWEVDQEARVVVLATLR